MHARMYVYVRIVHAFPRGCMRVLLDWVLYGLMLFSNIHNHLTLTI